MSFSSLAAFCLKSVTAVVFQASFKGQADLKREKKKAAKGKLKRLPSCIWHRAYSLFIAPGSGFWCQ